MQKRYRPLTDNQWQVIKPFLNWQRKRKLSLRRIFNAILYITRTGIQWRNLAQTCFPAWTAVYYYFRQWSLDGTLAAINLALIQLERRRKGRKALPSLGLVDSQSVKLAPMIFEHRGVDGDKKVNGRKRHIFTDTGGRIYAVHVHAANRHDSPQGVHLLQAIGPLEGRLKKVLADKSYRGTFAAAVAQRGLKFEVPERPEHRVGFALEKQRWVVERSLAWFNFYRRAARDWEHTVESSAAFLLLANISMVLAKM